MSGAVWGPLWAHPGCRFLWGVQTTSSFFVARFMLMLNVAETAVNVQTLMVLVRVQLLLMGDSSLAWILYACISKGFL